MRWLGVDRCRRDFRDASARRSRPGRLPGCPADCRLGDGAYPAHQAPERVPAHERGYGLPLADCWCSSDRLPGGDRPLRAAGHARRDPHLCGGLPAAATARRDELPAAAAHGWRPGGGARLQQGVQPFRGGTRNRREPGAAHLHDAQLHGGPVH